MYARKHWELFSNNYAVSQDVIDELRETLLYFSGGECDLCEYAS
jgi:hypothetical protein